jgi:hypothetical protein
MALEDEYAQPEEIRWEGRYIAAKTRGAGNMSAVPAMSPPR